MVSARGLVETRIFFTTSQPNPVKRLVVLLLHIHLQLGPQPALTGPAD